MVTLFAVLLLSGAAYGQKVFPDTTLTTVDTDTAYTLPGNASVTFDIRDMPNAVKVVSSDSAVDCGQAYRVEHFGDGTYEVAYIVQGGTIGTAEELTAKVTLDTATSVTLFLWVRE